MAEPLQHETTGQLGLMRAALAGVFGLLLGLACLEGSSRLYVHWKGWPLGDRYLVQPTPYFSPSASPAPPHYADLRLDPASDTLRLSDSPGLSFEYGWEKPPGTFRIVCIGDSITQIWPDTPNYTHALQSALSKELGDTVEVIPLGVGGYNPRLSFAAFAGWLKRLEPDFLVLQMGPNDVDILTYKPGPFSPTQSRLGLAVSQTEETFGLYGYNQKRPAIRPTSHAVFWAALGLHSLVLGDRNHGLKLVHDNRTLDAAIQDFGRLADTLAVPTVALVFPFFADRHTPLEEERILSLLQDSKIPAISLAEPLSALAPLKELSKDGIHPSPEGHRLAGLSLSRYLIDREHR